MLTARSVLGIPSSSSPEVQKRRQWQLRRATSSKQFAGGVALLIAGFSLLLIFARSASAQATDAAIIGNIADAQGGAIVGAQVTATNQETGLIRNIVTEEGGHYRLAPLPPGIYTVRAEQQGFAITELKGLTLTIGLELPQDIVLKVGTVEQSVTVTAEAPTVETSSSEVASDIVSREQIDTLPITQRQVANLALLEPGTTSDVGRVSRPLVSIGAGQVNGAGSNYLLDGLSNVIAGNGDPRDLVQEATVQEFKVILGQAPAEYGGRAAGIVSVATKGGTNNFHGEGFEFFRDHYINRVDSITQAQYDSNPAAFPIQPFSRNQFGGEIGGPIKRDKLYFLFSFEELNDQEYFTVSPGGGKTPALTAVYAPLEGSFRGGALFREYFGRVDYQFNSKNTAFFRYSNQNPAVNYNQTANGNAAAYGGQGDSITTSWTYAGVDSWIISPTTVNQVAFQVAQQLQDYVTPQYSTPSLYPNGSIEINFPDLTWGWQAPTQFHVWYQELRDDLTKTHTKHTFRFGADILRTPRRLDAAASTLGVWTFSKDYQPTAASPTFNPQDPSFNFATLASALPIKFTTNFPQINYSDQNLMQGYYAQDEWKILPNLTLNLGLRYDLQTSVWRNNLKASDYPQTLPYVVFGGHGENNNIAPRFGFAWDPFKDGRTVVRGGFGIVNVDLQDNAFDPEIYTLRQTQISIQGTAANPVPWPNPYLNFGGTAQSYLKTPQGVPNVNITANNVYSPKVFTYNLGVARQLGSDYALSAEGMYTHMYGLDINENLNTPVNPAAPTARPNSSFAQIIQSSPDGIYNYTGLFVRLDKRLSHRYQYVLSYTLAKQDDNYNASTARTDYYHPQEDFGPAVTDRRHNFVASGSVLLHWGINVGAIYTLRSALPFSVLAGADNNADGSITDYIPGTGKTYTSADLPVINAWRATKNLAPIPASQIESNLFNQLDARISKNINLGERYRIELIGQLFNVLGTNNYGGVGTTQLNNASTGSATSPGTFGTFTAALPKQQGELAVRFIF